MKIQIESYGKKYTFESESDNLTTKEIIEIITNLLVSAGYSYENVIETMEQYEK